MEEVEHNRRHCTTIRPSSTWVTLSRTWTAGGTQVADSDSIKQMHEHTNTNTEIQIHREHMGHTWAVTEASWREAGGSCGLLPPLLPPTATPPPTQPILCCRAYGAQNTEYVVQKNKAWSKIPENFAQNTAAVCWPPLPPLEPPPTNQPPAFLK